MSNTLIPIEITENTYEIPAIEHETLEVTTASETSSAEAGMIKTVHVPAGGVVIRFLKGGHPCTVGLKVTTRYYGDKEAEAMEANRLKAVAAFESLRAERDALKVEHEEVEANKIILTKMRADITAKKHSHP